MMTSFGEQDHVPSNFNLEQIKDLLEKDSSDYLRGADDKNLGWILRDSSISGSLPIEGKHNDDQTTESTTRISPVSSHLSAAISNTNDAVSNKTKATISPIHEEVVSPSKSVSDLASTSLANNRRRSSVSSNGSNGTGSSGGFLNKLKGKLSLKATSPPPTPTPTSNNVFKDNYNMSPTTRSRSNSIAGPKAVDPTHNGYELKKTISTPAYSELSSDPRLDEYVKLYRRNSERHPRRNSCISNLPEKVNTKAESSITQKFSFLKRRSSIQVGNLNRPERSSSETFDNELIGEIPDVCNTLKPLKRVGFHLQTFLIDPPQQIPSRNPRKGNVEIGPNGELIIKALSEKDKKAIEKSQLGQGGGLVVGGSGTLGLIKPSENSETSAGANDIEINKHARSVAIDKPMYTHERHSYKLPVERMALDVMYTRCCHLREILPIPAILKQIPKGSIAPLPILQMKNPSPTIIEVETFADFIRVAPILCVSLDGVSLSINQFKSILAAISSKTQLQKLSLRNCPLNSEGWSLLCLLLSQNKFIEKLDITQCPSLAVDLMKKKKKTGTTKKKEEEVNRMTCNKENRSDMNWTLFTATLIARGGIEELILTGCCINDLDIFEKLVKRALLIKTNRLSLAYNNLSVKQLKIVVENWVFKKFVRGLDLGYNDFLSVKFLNIWLEMKKRPNFDELISNSTINFLSLNATNLRFSKEFTEFFESVLLRLPSLKYLDLSNNCRLFGTRHNLNHAKIEVDSSSDKSESSSSTSKENEMSEESIISYFTMKFPLFPKLIRLHAENNNFSTSSLISIANTLPYCKNLVYISLIGNEIQMNAGAALIQGLKNSKSLITLDANFDKFPTIFKERVGLYGMRNLERLYLNKTKDQADLDQSDTSKLSLTEQLNQILIKKAEKKLDLDSPEVINIVKKANKIRLELTQTVNELLSLQLKNELNIEGKETLIRFVYINASIAKGLQLIDSSLVSQDENNNSVLLHLAHENESNQQNLEENHDHEPANISTVHTPPVLSRSASKTSLQERQEGSVLKLMKLHNFHNPDEEFYNDMSGDEIRDKLSNTNFRDLDNTIDYLVELKKKGVSMGKLFNMDSENDYISKLKVRLATEIQERLRDLCEIERNGKSKDSDQSSDNNKDISVKKNTKNDDIRNDDNSKVSNGSKNGKLQNGSKVNFDLFENKAGPKMEDNVNQSDNGEINQLYDEVLNTLPYLQK